MSPRNSFILFWFSNIQSMSNVSKDEERIIFCWPTRKVAKIGEPKWFTMFDMYLQVFSLAVLIQNIHCSQSFFNQTLCK